MLEIMVCFSFCSLSSLCVCVCVFSVSRKSLKHIYAGERGDDGCDMRESDRLVCLSVLFTSRRA